MNQIATATETTDGKISLEAQRMLIENKIQQWINSRYDAELDARVAAALDNKEMLKQAERRMKNALKAVDLLKEMLEEIE